GKDIGQYGVYREIAAPERLVHTESWEDWNPGEVLVTIDLAEREGKTTYTCTMLYPSQEVRDTLIKSGMADGAAETYDKLAELLAALVGAPASAA
ncbi:MAG TPA: SRPBCC domain-containing protein, partial [Thermoanaerobaculia bacterium]|nr:SRPBCC domain-containing protein [Thermoanaerobaculia bacterium]